MIDERGDVRVDFLASRLPQMIFGSRANGERTCHGPQWAAFTGMSDAKSLGFGWLDAIHPEDRPLTLDAWSRAAECGEYLVEHRIRHAADGEYRWHQTRAAPLRDTSVGEDLWAGGATDVDDLRRLQARTAAAEGELRTLIEGVPQLIWRSGDMGDWTWASPQWLDFTGQSQQQSHGRGWLGAVHPDDREATMAAWAAARPHGILDVEFRVRRAVDGTWLWHRTRSTPVRNGNGRIVEWLGTTTDIQELKELQARQQVLLAELQYHARDLDGEIRERKRVEARLLYGALHDDLTRLRNRAFLADRLRLALGAKGGCAVLLLGLDRFKLVNDSLGREAGDLMLVEVARRLEECVGEHAVLARLGGDEFAVLVEDAGDAVPTATSLAARFIGAMRRPIWLGPQEVFTTCSIGIARTTAEHHGPDDVLRDADLAMRHAKRHGPGGYAVFTGAMRQSAVEALELRADLRHAVRRDELHLEYQPICDAASGNLVGLEVSVCWRHPRRGAMAAATFLGIGEEAGLIREIGRWVLWTACGQLRAWQDRFPGLDLRLGVNVSGEELQGPDFCSELGDVLSATGIAAQALQIEVGEGILLERPEVAQDVLGRIRALGVHVALDDFGAGFSSLSHLDRYRVDAVKIDRSFADGMLVRPATGAIVEAIARLGRSLELTVVAQGVAEAAQLDALRVAGCGLAQGDLTGRPMSVEEVSAMIARQSDRGAG